MNYWTICGALVASVVLGGCMATGRNPAARNLPVDEDILQAEYGPQQAAARTADRDVVRTVWGPQSEPYAIGKPAAASPNAAKSAPRPDNLRMADLGWN